MHVYMLVHLSEMIYAELFELITRLHYLDNKQIIATLIDIQYPHVVSLIRCLKKFFICIKLWFPQN